MLLSVTVVPGPPAFVAELMGSAAVELDGLRQATDRGLAWALSDLRAASISLPASSSGWPSGVVRDAGLLQGAGAGPVQAPGGRPVLGPGDGPVQLIVVGPGQPAEFNASGPVSFASFGREVVVPAMVEGQPGERELPTPIMVARYLASRDIAAHPEHADLWAAARWVTTNGGRHATALGERLRADPAPVALVLVADGATCHGPKAPRAQDPRAAAYDEGVCAALASGEPGRLAQIDGEIGDALGATGGQVWPVFVAAAGSDGIGEVHWTGAPYGVGWTVASWRHE